MATTIVTKNSSTASAVPTAGQLVQGELAVNVADKKLYTEDNAGSIIVLADGVKLAGIEALADVTDTANVTAAGALMDSELTNITAVKALNQGVATTDSPTFAGATLTTADINAGTIDGTVIGGSTAAAGTFTTGQFNTSLNVDGTATTDGLTVDGSLGSFAVQSSGAEVHFSRNDNNDILANGGTSASFTIGANNNLTFKTGATLTQRLQIASNGNLSLYEDTGTTAKFFWDASAESLGIGTTSPSLKGHINNASSGLPATSGTTQTNGVLRLSSSATSGIIDFGMNSSSPWIQATDYTGLNNNYNLLLNPNGGNVGIGTSSPAANRSLHVSSAPQNQARFERTGASTVQIEFQDSTTTNQPSLGGDGDSLTFRTSFTERLRIDSSGNVGIGRTPDTVYSGSLQLALGNASQLATSTAGNPSLTITDNSYLNASGNHVYKTTNPSTRLEQYNGTLTFSNAASGTAGATISYAERMRIDSSGNLLVGKTALDNSTAGTRINSDGSASFVKNGNLLYLNRNTTDGDIVTFAKDNTTVGSIGTSAETMYVSSAQAGGMKFTYLNSTNALMIPVTTAGSNADATHDLGYSSSRFRDLYLSGGVYLGGTGAANKLDDFEEGTWTPNQGAGLTVVGAFQSEGYYTKIGNLVTISGFVGGATSVTCSAGGTLCTNAIFTSAAAGVLWAGSVINWNADSGASCAVQQNTTNVYNGTEVTTSAKISFCVTYRV
jgi:hypothetical protein